MQSFNYMLIAPELFLLGMICVVMLADLFIVQSPHRRFTYLLTQLTLLGTLILTLSLYSYSDTISFYGLFIHDQVSMLLKATLCVTSMLVFAFARDYLVAHDIPAGEFYLLGLFSILGMLVAVSAHHFLSLYLGLELMSLPIYAMVALYRDSAKATEAAIKYFVLGALSSGMLLYGLSMLYGATHSLDMTVVAQAISTMPEQQSLVLVLGLVFVIAGIAFKLAAVPFHMWVPDVYEGAPVAATLFITVAPKIAAFGITYRLLIDAMPGLHVQWQDLLIILAVLSMVIGNVAAIVQTNIRRMLAYSTIAHGGYMILGFCAGTPDGFAASMYYAMVYGVMSIAGFGMLTMLSGRGIEVKEIEDLRGLNTRNPWLALVMLISLFSMAGIPPTVGFFAKLGVLQALVYAPVNLIWLACLAIVLAVIGSYYYLRVVKVMYFDEPEIATPIRTSMTSRISISITGLAILLLGILPSSVINLVHVAVMG